MRRLALLAATVLAVAAAPAARAEPLDVDLTRLGAPDPQIWSTIYKGVAPAGTTYAQLATDSRQRFALLSTEVAMALSSAMLQPASTTGYSGFAVDLEIASMAVHPDPVGVGTAAPAHGFSSSVWPTNTQPTSLFMPSVHVRKALPFSFELGGRLIYLASSNAYAAQGEAKWAINEGFEWVPDVAFRAAYTQLFGVRAWNLSTTDLDFMISRRWAIQGVTSLTPYLAARYTFVSASSDKLDFAPTSPIPASSAGAAAQTQAAFPHFSTSVYRTTFGVRFTAYTASLALEGTYFGGATTSDSDYEGVKLKSTFGGAAKLGWEW
jgi:hypothetical protein